MRVADLSAEWLSARLNAPVSSFETQRIGTGQMSDCYRVALRYERDTPAPASVVLKVAASDPVSRQTGVALGLYEREVRFYAEVAPWLVGPIAPCYHASFDAEAGTFALLLGDAGPAEVGDEIEGTSLERARLAVSELGRLHGPAIGDPTLATAAWLNREAPITQPLLAQLYAGFAERYADRIAPRHREVCDRLIASFDAYAAADDGPRGLVHGDYRLDNMLFGTAGADRPLTVVDWQTVAWGPVATDLAYFLGCALTVPRRRQYADELIAIYHAALSPTASLTLDDVREGVRRQSFFGVMMAIVSPMLVQRTERGDDMFMAMIERHCEQVLDTDALALLPESVAPQPLQPDPADEFSHPPGSEPMWNESWYCDFVDPQQGVGGYVRLGLTPHGGWFTALLCGPGQATVAVLDFAAPMTDPYTVHTDAFDFAHSIATPLQKYRLVLRARGEAHDDPAALLRGEPGRAADISMDLEWSTVGTPYQYRLTPRYEIACAVTGTVSVDGRVTRLDAVPGQRDHSWGVRDWWGMDWVWSALHLDDGTHLHGVDIRLPGAPPISVGYIQAPGAPLTELHSVSARASFADNGLPLTTAIIYDELEAAIDIRGHAPLRLEAPDGRVAWFARSWASVTTSDGRSGAGWIEWNRSNIH
ncbi:MAG: phosphotransferase [Candidatus Sericytochromatia bacterium]